MELTQLRYFAEAARLQHITRAAEQLHIAQPALTQALHRLEAELEVPLFVQRGRGVVLTPYGELLKERAQEILRAADALKGEMQQMAKTQSSTVHMNVLAASYIVTEAVIGFKQEKKHINFQMGQSEENTCDISVSTRLFHKRAAGDRQYVFSERIFAAVPADGAYGKMDKVSLGALKNEEFIALAGSRQFRMLCDGFCSQAGFEPNVVFQSDNPTAVKNLIAAGVGVGFWPEYSWGELNNPAVALVELAEPECSRDIIVSLYNNKSENKAVHEFYDYLTACFLRFEKTRRQ